MKCIEHSLTYMPYDDIDINREREREREREKREERNMYILDEMH